ncbi:MAG: carboxylate--amine ligase [Oscillospiraceae bacterium]|nr:carboxylate--amine ligase [Oscillospiraceae bacterium]
MPSIKYRLRVLTGMRFKKFTEVLDRAHEKSGRSRIWLTKDMLHCARKFGSGYYDYVTFGFWDLTDEQRATYVTRFVSKDLVTLLNDPDYAEIFNDKVKFYNTFRDFIKREFIDYRTASKEEVLAFAERHPVMFAKPAHGSCGHDCHKVYMKDYADLEEFYRRMGEEDAWLLEEVLEQHPRQAEVYPHAMNCLRLITLLDSGGEPHVIFATQKFGLNGRVVDNYGFGCRVDLETGRICSPGVSGDGSLGIVYDEHPLTHVKLVGREVPMFFEACEMVKKAALVVPRMRYIGWDVGITPDGPAIVEGNHYTAHDFWQLPAQTPEKTGMLPVFRQLVPEYKR